MSPQVLFWATVAAVGCAFFGFALTFVHALNEGAGSYSRAMGAETSRQFEDVFMFISPAKIARLGRIAAFAAFFLFFIPLFSFTSVSSTAAGVVLGFLASCFVFTLPKKYEQF